MEPQAPAAEQVTSTGLMLLFVGGMLLACPGETHARGRSYEPTLTCDSTAAQTADRELPVADLDRSDPMARGRVLERIREAVDPALVVPVGARIER